ncbi:hypothetical protein G6F57_013151 [Rhizopus arrhizus]|nr:hypothetical protein G6F57_013151 [Rhizopus arrhizus]
MLDCALRGISGRIEACRQGAHGQHPAIDQHEQQDLERGRHQHRRQHHHAHRHQHAGHDQVDDHERDEDQEADLEGGLQLAGDERGHQHRERDRVGAGIGTVPGDAGEGHQVGLADLRQHEATQWRGGQRPRGLEVDLTVEVGRHAGTPGLVPGRHHHHRGEEQGQPQQHLVGWRLPGAQCLAQQAQHDDDAGERGQYQQHRRDQGDRRHQQQGLQRQADRRTADLADVDVRQRRGRRAGRGERQCRQQAQGKQQQPRHQGGNTGTGDTHVRGPCAAAAAAAGRNSAGS